MRLALVVRRALLLTAVSFVTVGPACVVEPDPPASRALRGSFPEQADRVLQGSAGLVATETGFAPRKTATGGAWSRVQVELPRDATSPVHLRLDGGFEVRVREVSVEGEGTLVEQAVAYRRAGGTSYWTAALAGPEEWLHLDAGRVRRGEVIAAWDVEGGTLHGEGAVVTVADADGRVRLRVTAPTAFAAGGRPIEARLATNGARLELYVEADGEEVLVDPVWGATSAMNAARSGATATLLPTGQVVVAGGASTPSAETYNPLSDGWTPTAPMNVARASHTATLLTNGTILVAGGGITAVSQTSAEIYDPSNNTWTLLAAPMVGPHTMHTATLLQNGQVLLAGGSPPAPGAELYTPGAAFTAVKPMVTARALHAAARLASGQVLVMGGQGASGLSLASAELFDPVNGTWTATTPLSGQRQGHTATVLPDGRVLVACGLDQFSLQNGQILATAELFTAPSTWGPAAGLAHFRQGHTATLLGNGHVLVAGGYANTAEMYDPATDTWEATSPMTVSRAGHAAALLGDGVRVLAAGGSGAATAELYTPLGQGTVCTLGGDCASGHCVSGVCCNTACAGGATCNACSVAAGGLKDGICSQLSGTACDDGNPCTQTDTCQTGACVGGNPVTCPQPDPCHLLSTCNPATGTCPAQALKPDGTACDDGDPCTQTDLCKAGVCTGANPVQCKALDACHVAGQCVAATGQCTNPSGPDGVACNDNDPCTQGDKCVTGTCTGVPVQCMPQDACHVAGQCIAATGQCTNPSGPDGVACNDNDPCTQTDTCKAGVCTGANPVICPTPDPCHTAATCDQATGTCPNPAKPDGSACDDGNACTQTDTCKAGLCTGANAVTCPMPDPCHEAGVCDHATGLCSKTPKADGATCSDGDACTQGDACKAGACVPGAMIDCKAKGPCENDGTCVPGVGQCQNGAKPDGTLCPGGSCVAGNCETQPSGTGSGAAGSGPTGAGATGSGSTASGTSGSGAGGGAAHAGPSTGASGAAGGGTGGGAGAKAGGCGCTSAGAPAASPSWLLLGLLLARRRRQRAGHRAP